MATGTAAAPTHGTAVPGEAAAARPKRRLGPFYQLYLLSTVEDHAAEHRGEYVLRLRKAGARTCARLLEMLYVPVGRSGSADECYLLYENVAEFEAAAALAPVLDVPPLKEPTSAVGSEASFRVGVGLLLQIVEQGAIVDPGQVDECEHHLAAATQSARLPPLRRWAAGIFAGRLVSEYRYDFAAARSYCRQAERAARPGSLEQMTAMWWRADAFTQEGKSPDARAAYEAILAAHEEDQGRSHIVRRSQAILGRRR